MLTLTVDYCAKCGSIFQKNMRNLCSSCSNQLDLALKNCMDYMWRFPKATTEALSEATQVPLAELHDLIKQGKLSNGYKNLTYPCECCLQPIAQGRLCSGCSTSFKDAFQTAPKAQSTVVHGAPSLNSTGQKVLFTSKTRSSRR